MVITPMSFRTDYRAKFLGANGVLVPTVSGVIDIFLGSAPV